MPDRICHAAAAARAVRYTDTAALNDIHALLTSTDPGDGALADIALILARTGRPHDRRSATSRSQPPRPRSAGRWPASRPGDTSVLVRQATDRHRAADRDLHQDRRRARRA